MAGSNANVKIQKIAKLTKPRKVKNKQLQEAMVHRAENLNATSITQGNSTPPVQTSVEKKYLICKLLKSKKLSNAFKAAIICHLQN